MYNLSVVVCCYQGAKTLLDCLESLAKQKTKKKFEVIIVDDGSIDGTDGLIESFIKSNSKLNNPTFTFFKKENEGLSCTRNYGIERTNSQIIAFIDQDAVAAPEWVENIVNEFNKSDSPQIIGGPVQLLNNESKFADFIFNSFQSLEMKSPVAVIGTNMAFSKSLFDNDTYFHPAFVSRGDESYIFQKMRLKYNILPKQVNTIVVKHETPATLKAWLKTRYHNGFFGAIIDNMFDNKRKFKTLLKIIVDLCCVMLFLIFLLLPFIIKNYYALIPLPFLAYFLYRRYIRATNHCIKEYRKNASGNIKLNDIMLLIFSSINGFFYANYGYIKGCLKYRKEI